MQPDSSAQDGHAATVRILARLEQQLGPKDYRHWFDGKVALRAAGELVSVGVASPFLVNWMQKRFRREIAAAAQDVLGPAAIVQFCVASQPASPADADAAPMPLEPPAESPPVDGPAQRPASSATTVRRSAAITTARAAPPGQRRFNNLDEFVAGESSELALLAAFNVARAPGAQHNPLFLYGENGCGKTHLLEGTYREVRRRHPTLKTVYLTAEAFTNYFTQALRNHKLPGFRERFRTVDVLLVDEVHFFEGKKATQEEFLHTFDQLTSHGRQIVLAADRQPRLLGERCPKLSTRLVSGLTCRVQAPGCEGRLELLRRRCRRMKVAIKPEALDYVARRFSRDVRELIGALNCLATQYELTRKPVGMTSARRLLAGLERDAKRMIGIPDVERAVCEFFRVQPDELQSARRTRSITQPRMLAMFLARKHTAAGYTEIGEHFGGRNHATVINAEKRVREWLDTGQTVQVANERWPLSDVVATIERRLAG
ncbi:MAG: chromosomal replication initiator protein DnaA [Planctomycetaceae bacterium]